MDKNIKIILYIIVGFIIVLGIFLMFAPPVLFKDANEKLLESIASW